MVLVGGARWRTGRRRVRWRGVYLVGFTRFYVVGGFGIGLNIVYLIAKEYNLKINVSSKLKIGTKIEISW